MRTCPSCGRLTTDASAGVCLFCGAALEPSQSASESPQPATPEEAQPATPSSVPGYGPPYTPYAPPPPYGQPPYGPSPYGPGYGAPAPYSQPMPSAMYALPSQPMAPPYGQPSYGAGYGPPGGYPTGYPGALPPGADWKPGQRPNRTPWGRIIGGIVVALVVIAIVAGVSYGISQAATHNSGAKASATATATQNSSVTLLSDSMLTADSSWIQDSACYFRSDGYHIVDAYICNAPIGEQVDGSETVTVKQVSGPTTWAYGLILRHISTGNYYIFGIDSDSQWVFAKLVNDKPTNLQNFTFNKAIKGGLNTANTLSVTMTGNTFDCYINGQKVGTIHDSTFSQGEWGLEGGPGIDVVFTNYLAQR